MGVCGHGLRGILVAIALAAAGPARALEDGMKWLLQEPVSLFDLGMYRLRQDMAEVARRLGDEGQTAGKPWSGAFYQWREERIIAYVTMRERLSDPTEARCREIFALMSRYLTEGLPKGTRQAEIYLEDLFLHPGFGNFGRPRRIGAELAQMVRFEVTLLPPPPVSAGGRRINCAGRLDTDPKDVMISATN